MSTQPKDGGPAHSHIFLDPRYGSGYPGMSLRDYFAGQAIAGLLPHVKMDAPYPVIAEACYEIADAMLAEREKGGEK